MRFTVHAEGIGSNLPVTCSKLYYFQESDSLLSPGQALRLQQAGRFQQTSNSTINFGNTKNRYWLYLEVGNQQEAVDLVLEINNAHLYRANLYQVTPALIEPLFETGSLLPFQQRPIMHRNLAFPLRVAAKSSIAYLLMLDRRDEVLKFSIQLYTKKAFEHRSNRLYWFYGCFAGILLFIILFSIFLRITLRDPLYTWYLLYMVFLLLFILTDSGMAYEFLWSNWPKINQYARTFLGILSFMSQLRFMQLLIGQERNNSRFYQPIQWSQYFFTVIMLLTLTHLILQPSLSALWMMVYNVLFTAAYLMGCCLVIASLMEKAILKNKEAQLYLIAIFPYFCHILLLMLTRWGVLSQIDSAVTMVVSSTIEIMILSFGIALKYNSLKRKKEALQTALYAEKKRTMEKVMDSQEDEKKRIAQDLHDDLGGTLATIKGMLSNIRLAGEQQQIVADSQHLLDKACQDLRVIAHDLMPAEFDTVQLSTIMEETILKANTSSSITHSFITTGTPVPISKRVTLTLYRIVNEALHNISKHSKASHAIVQLIYHSDHLQLLIEDNGIGFSMKDANADLTGIGLKNIFSRSDYLNATLHIDSGKSGTTIICNVPYESASHPSE